MSVRGVSLAAVALCGCLEASVSTSAFAEPSYAQATKYNLDISEESLTTALPALSRQTGVVVLYPYDLAQVRSNPVKGLYTVPEALQIMLQGTGFSGDVTAQGAVSISRQNKRCDTEGEAMLRDSKSTVSVIALLASLFSTSVCAQTAPASGGGQGPQDSGEAVESVVVTGSRVITDAANSPTPVVAVSQNELLATTPTTIADALNKLPQFAASSSRQNAGGASSNGGGNYLNLRNFGQQRTLVLQDGMRVPSTNANGSVDISVLPQMLVSHVDVVTGGASSVYGSDAITGVVNFILDKNFEGLKYQANAGLSTYGDGLTDGIGFAAGTSLFGGKGHIEGELGFNHADEVLKDNRPQGAANWSSYGTGSKTDPITNIKQGRLNVSSPNGTIVCTNCSVNGQQFIANNVIGPFNFGTPTTTSSISIGGDGGYWGTGAALAATTRENGFARFSYDLDDNTVFFAQFTGSQARVFSHFIPSQIDAQRGTINYFKDNPYLSAADQARLGNDCATDPNCHTDGTNIFQSWKWLGTNTAGNPETPGQPIDDPTRRTNSVQRLLSITTGLSGQVFGGFDWNVHFTHGEARDSITGINNGNNQYADASHDVVLDNGHAVCYNDTAAAIALYGNIYPGCVPMDSFGPTSISQAAFNYWSRNTNASVTQKLSDIEGDISGNLFDLPAGPIRGALSGEMRWLDYVVNSNASPTQLVNCFGLRLCNIGTTQTYWDNNTLASVTANENVWEFSGEANIPILKDLPLIQELSSDIAGRYTDYSVSGAVETWKIGLDWRMNDDIRIRGTTSVDIRAPTLNDLYTPPTQTSIGYTDNLTKFGNGLEQQSQGNPNLVPEVSRTYTAGIVYTPSYIPGLSASVDFFNINLKNAISNVAGSNVQVQQICNASGGTSPYCALYVRPFPYSNTTPANYPTLLYSENLNSAFVSTEGEDYEIDYAFDTADVDPSLKGLVNLRAFVTVQPKIDASSFPGAQIQHNAGAGGTTATQKGHASFLVGYTLGDWNVNYQLTWYGDEWKNGLLQTPLYYAVPRVPSFNTSDITIKKKITLGDGSDASVYVTVNNIANALAPIVTGSVANPGVGTATPTGEDVMGRYFTIGIRGNL
jgi:outer membrane cobalamin receptor